MNGAKALLGITVITLTGCSSLGGSSDLRGAMPPVSADTLERHVAVLSDDTFAGRAPGTEGGRKTRAYLVSEMTALGLEPLGDSFEHPVTLVSRALDPSQSAARFNLPGGGADGLAYGPEAVFSTKRDDERVSIQDSDVVFVGHGIVAPEFGWDDYAGIDARGKTVVMLINDPGFRQQGDLFGGNAMSYYGRWTYKYEEAARQGADAAIIIHQTAPAAYGWGVVEGSWSGPQLDLPRSAGDTPPVKLEGWITLEQAEALFAAAGLDFDAMEEAATRPGFKPVDLGDVSFSAELYQNLEVTESANVAGVIRGAEAPDEYVLYTAHWDHLGTDPALEAAGEDGIYNGAVDNATGTGAILALAEAIKRSGVQPKRSHLFLAVTAEESGLLGAKAFASNPPVPLANIVGGLNIDAMLPLGEARNMTVIGYGASELEDILRKAAGRKGLALSADPSPEKGYFYRSDHVEFAKRGVPMLYVKGGTDLKDGGPEAGKAAEAAYTGGPYHAPSDEYDPETWSFEGMVQVLDILGAVAARLSETDVAPNWYEGNEFRAIRDAQLDAAGK